MKKLLLLVLTLLPMLAWAENLERIYINGLYYNLYEDENGDNWARVTSKSYGNNNGTAYYGDIIIPSLVVYNDKSYNVTRIDNGAFKNCKDITSIKIPDSVTHIEEEAFMGCSGLNTINIPSSVVYICDYAFNGTGWYNNQPDGILYLDNWIIGFKGEKPTGNITIAEGTKGIANLSFWNCDYLTNITIPNSVAYIGSRAFEGCSTLISINIPNGVTHIEGGTFYGCSSLTTVTIPNSVTTIENTVRGYGAFGRCSGLTSVTFGNSLTRIGNDAFLGCTGLVTVSIPSQVTSINNGAFYGCTGLTTIMIPSSVDTIGSNAFANCRNLNSVHISDIEAWCKVSFSDEKSNPLSYAHHLYHGEEEIKDLVIPNSVESIGDYTFDGCIGLKSVTIPNSVTRIGDYAFYNCGGLTSVSIPNSVTNIGIFAFANCNLTSVDIPNSVTTVGESAFEGCWNMETMKLPDKLQIIRKSTFSGCNSLKSVTIPTTVEFIYQEAFANCYGLESVNALPSTPPFLYDNSFSDFLVHLKVPKGCKEAYQTAQGWKNFTNISDADKYKLTYVVDGDEYKSYEVEEGTNITPEPVPTKDGYTFSGWSEIPSTMPAYDVTVTGTFSINSYKLTYMMDDTVYKETVYEYGATIAPEPQPEGDYATFEWIDLPLTMPAHDVVVYASYTSGIIEVLMMTQRNIRIYSPSGNKLDKLIKGINIIRMNGGRTNKIVVK